MIEQQYAAIGIQSTPAQMHITTNRPQMSIHHTPAEVSVERIDPSFTLDWQRVWSESGLKRPNELSRSERDKAYQKTMDAIGADVQEGNYLSDLTQPGDRVAELHKRENLKPSDITFNITSMPESPPDVTWDTGSINISWSRYNLTIEWDSMDYMPDIVVDPPYSVEVFLRNQPSIRISVEEGGVPYDAGAVVDRYIGDAGE